MISKIRGSFLRLFIFAVTTATCFLILWTSHTATHKVRTTGTRDQSQSPTSFLRRVASALTSQKHHSKYEEMVQAIRSTHLTPPSTLEYNLTHPTSTHESHYTKLVFEVFGRSKPGVFIEAGAWDGEDASNTLQLEQLGWKGILVECNPQALPKLMSRHRKAWIADVCLSITGEAGNVKFYSAPEWPSSAQINKQLSLEEMKVHGIDWMKNKTWVEYERPSFPMQAVVGAIGEFTEIDFLSLDVQGAEVGILKHYDFDMFPIKLIIAEVHTFGAEERNELSTLLFSKGYRFYKDLGADWAYILKEYAPKRR